MARGNPIWDYDRILVARNLTDSHDGFLAGTRYLLMDRVANFSDAFRSILKDAGVQSVRLPARSPNLNAHLERFMRSLKAECLDRMIFFGDAARIAATSASRCSAVVCSGSSRNSSMRPPVLPGTEGLRLLGLRPGGWARKMAPWTPSGATHAAFLFEAGTVSGQDLLAVR